MLTHLWALEAHSKLTKEHVNCSPQPIPLTFLTIFGVLACMPQGWSPRLGVPDLGSTTTKVNPDLRWTDWCT